MLLSFVDMVVYICIIASQQKNIIMQRKHRKPKGSTIFTHPFVHEMIDGGERYVQFDAFATNKKRTELYINSYAYASSKEDEENGFDILVIKEGNKLFLPDNPPMLPSVVDKCPKGWICISVEILSYDVLLTQEESMHSKDVDDALIQHWATLSAEDLTESLVTHVSSLERSNISSLLTIPTIVGLKEFTCDRITQEIKLQNLESILYILDCEISKRTIDNDDDMDENKREDAEHSDAVKIFAVLRSCADKRHKILIVPKSQRGFSPTNIRNMSLDDVKKNVKFISRIDREAFLREAQNEKNDFTRDDFAKAAFLRDHK